jgi:hypothetical protein
LVERGVKAVAADRPLEAMDQLGSAVSAPMDETADFMEVSLNSRIYP